MTHQFWNKAVLATSFLLVLCVFSVNVFIDPANIFGHSHPLNRWKSGFDERLQKTSYLTHRVDITETDTLLFGSSRNTYYDKENFEELNVFNYAVSNGNPEEYATFLNYAQSLKKEAFPNIIIGLDFVGYGFVEKNKTRNALLINDIQSPFFWSKYISYDMLINSAKTIVSSLYKKVGTRVYDKHNNTYLSRVDPKITVSAAQRRSTTYYARMVFDEGYFDALRSIKANNPNSHFLIFTNPVSMPFLTAIYDDPMLKAGYFNWITKMVETFGDIYFFTYPNDFSYTYMTRSKDGDHYYKETLTTISDIIQGRTSIAPYGLKLNMGNLDTQLKIIKQLIGSEKQ